MSRKLLMPWFAGPTVGFDGKMLRGCLSKIFQHPEKKRSRLPFIWEFGAAGKQLKEARTKES